MEIQIFGARNSDLIAFRKRISDLAADLGVRELLLREINSEQAITRKVGSGPRAFAINGRIAWSGETWPDAETVEPILLDAVRKEVHNRIDEPAAVD